MDIGDAANIVPEAPAESAGSAGTPQGSLSYLSGSWVNTRLVNVANKVSAILDSIIGEGLLSDGFAPFESPVTDEMLTRMTPDQLQTFLSTIPSLEQKADIIARLKDLKLPGRIEFPFESHTHSPAPEPKLTFDTTSRYSAGEGTV